MAFKTLSVNKENENEDVHFNSTNEYIMIKYILYVCIYYLFDI